ncbi:MAG: radical SAM protein [Chloroflexi bacterium]|nr:radical SAM protein [Chloroflexota bacterium]
MRRDFRYLDLFASGELRKRVEIAYALLRRCVLCPHQCGVNRLNGERGVCNSGADLVIASHNAHHGEEPPISGEKGSGTIFFSNCTGKCLFCQNYPISQLGVGNQATVEGLAKMMLSLQRKGCHNINFVTPTHFVPQILAALEIAIPQGLGVPLLYNTSGYDSLVTLQLLDGVIDIYLPDAKYADDKIALRLSGFPRYVESNHIALKEMYRQVGDLQVDEAGLATRGMIVRHMVLPQGLAGTAQVMRFIAREISPNTYVSLMDQYFPAHRAVGHPQLGRKTTPQEYDQALQAFQEAGLVNGWMQVQEYSCAQV